VWRGCGDVADRGEVRADAAADIERVIHREKRVGEPVDGVLHERAVVAHHFRSELLAQALERLLERIGEADRVVREELARRVDRELRGVEGEDASGSEVVVRLVNLERLARRNAERSRESVEGQRLRAGFQIDHKFFSRLLNSLGCEPHWG
jgi:hypothetical protein